MGGVVKPDRREPLPARIWNTTNQQLEVLKVASNGPIAFQDRVPVGLHVDEKGVPEVRSLESGNVLRSLEVPAGYKLNEKTDASISQDGALVGFGLDGPDNRSALAVSDARTGKLSRILPGRFACMSISPDKNFAAAGSQTGHVTVWSLSDGREVARFEDGWNTVHCLSWGRNPMQPLDDKAGAPDAGWLLAAGDAGGFVRVWDVKRRILRARCRWQSLRRVCGRVLARRGYTRLLRPGRDQALGLCGVAGCSLRSPWPRWRRVWPSRPMVVLSPRPAIHRSPKAKSLSSTLMRAMAHVPSAASSARSSRPPIPQTRSLSPRCQSTRASASGTAVAADSSSFGRPARSVRRQRRTCHQPRQPAVRVLGGYGGTALEHRHRPAGTILASESRPGRWFDVSGTRPGPAGAFRDPAGRPNCPAVARIRGNPLELFDATS